jgi:hypothetical protein
MIGASLSERLGWKSIDAVRGIELLEAAIATQGAALIEVRRQDPAMIACLVLAADKRAVTLCRQMGLEMKLGGTGVVGLLGVDAARLFPGMSERHRAWLERVCGPRETKVLLVRGGFALLSIDTTDGKTVVSATP